MGRFILIDHSLVDYAGHHYEYARAVLDAAAEAGYEPVLATNRSFRGQLSQSWPIVPAYKYGTWLHQGAPAWQIAVWRAWKAVRRGAQCRFSLREKTSFRRAKSDIGLGEDGETRSSKPTVLRASFEAVRQQRFVRDTANLLERLAVTEEDLIFIPTLSLAELESLGVLWNTAPRVRRPAWHLLFRRPLEAHRSACDISSDNFGGVFACGNPSVRVHYWTDSDELTDHYQRSTGRPFGTLPIPHTDALPPAAAPSERLRVLYLGDARTEKGFQHLPRLVRALTDDETAQPRFEFCFQAHSASPCEAPEITQARAELKQLAARRVALVTSPLSPAAYRELLASGHIVVLPYDCRAYAERSSGVFAEALAAGIPIIVPQGTWMARQLPPDGGAAFACPDQIATVTRTLAANYKTSAIAARNRAVNWRRQHNADRLLSLLAAKAARASNAGPRPRQFLGAARASIDLVDSRNAK